MRISDWSSDVCSSDLWRGKSPCQTCLPPADDPHPRTAYGALSSLQARTMAEGIVIGPTHHDRRFIKIMLGRWRRDGPLQSCRAPRICPCWLAVAQRMEQIDESQPIAQRQQ